MPYSEAFTADHILPKQRSSSSLNQIAPVPYQPPLSLSPSPGASLASNAAILPSPNGADDDRYTQPAIGPIRSQKSASGAGERRKRTRVTPEQLVHLEKLFADERSPPSVRRREISVFLGMEERQTQVWFQNRRAKEKILRLKAKDEERSRSMSAPDLPVGFFAGSDLEANSRTVPSEDIPFTSIPCDVLRIGNWQRHNAKPDQRDLVVFSCDAKELLTVQVSNAGLTYRMEIPYDTVVRADFTPETTAKGTASFTLARPPRFLQARKGAWESGSDWTEEGAATVHLQHILSGSAPELSNLVQVIQRAGQRPKMDSYLSPFAEKPSLDGEPYEYAKSAGGPHRYAGQYSRAAHRPSHAARAVSSIAFPPAYSEPDLQPHASASHFGSLYPSVDYPDIGSKGMSGAYSGSLAAHAQHALLNQTVGPAGQPYFAPAMGYQHDTPYASSYARRDFQSDSRTLPLPMTTEGEFYGQQQHSTSR
ncbi:homeobox-domain-containing protein [Cylindrobasidium torrendii FP15055 ss-10]|uniref:Homeobox-domain-containing protein n=1 Tax=Cylindrobasidium torrendii FP15055 ss-10 TaxID=1314674 RepID=A0A0D7BF45_9AGAR|nr:homeobox-domain-containing protein [Cylindrobasidium torrendii FP15055 ss-10]